MNIKHEEHLLISPCFAKSCMPFTIHKGSLDHSRTGNFQAGFAAIAHLAFMLSYVWGFCIQTGGDSFAL